MIHTMKPMIELNDSDLQSKENYRAKADNIDDFGHWSDDNNESHSIPQEHEDLLTSFFDIHNSTPYISNLGDTSLVDHTYIISIISCNDTNCFDNTIDGSQSLPASKGTLEREAHPKKRKRHNEKEEILTKFVTHK